MSINTEITRIDGAKSSIKTAIEGKGVTVPSATKIDGMAAYISQIPTGGGTPYAIISVTYPSGSVCTCTKGSTVLTAEDTSGKFLFNIPESGTWIVNCTDGVYTVSENVNIIGQYSFADIFLTYKTMPVKGSIINMDIGNGIKQYRVLKIDKNIAEVVALYRYYSTGSAFGTSQNYANSSLDELLNNTMYKSLSSEAKTAIIDKDITQYKYTNGSYDANTHASYADYSTKALQSLVGMRHIYALDIEDVEEYFGGTSGTAELKTQGTFNNQEFIELFWGMKPSPDQYIWLRSANTNYYKYVFCGVSNPGYAYLADISEKFGVNPAFQIDLLKIEWI